MVGVFTSSDNAFGSTCKPAITLIATNVTFIEVNNTYVAKAIILDNITEGTFYMVFLVNGIESMRSKSIHIRVISDNVSVFPLWIEIFWSFVTVVLATSLNSIVLNKFYPIVTIIAVGIEIVFVQQSTNGILFAVVSYVILGHIIFFISTGIVNEIRQGSNANFANVRVQVFRQYTAQNLNGVKVRIRRKMNKNVSAIQ